MPNSLTSTGLTTASQTEILNNLTVAIQSIYGADITLTSDTPDGQWLNIIVQTVVDLQDLLVQIYNGFDPDNAIGNVLDQRVAINGITRQGGTYTITNVTIINSQSVNLYGLDQDVQPVYTVQDNAGNNWFLETTVLGIAAGTHVYAFRAQNPGQVLTVPNTITIQVTVVLGVTSVNNPTTYTTLGINEESDAALKIRRQLSTSLASQGYYAGLLAALQNINGVTSAYIYENFTSSTNVYGVPGHSIWVIVAGDGAPADIAQAIYTKRNAGCGMYGAQSYVITQVDGSLFTVYWDDVVQVNVFVKFTAESLNGTVPPNIQAIEQGLPSQYVPGVFEEININALATAVQEIDPNTLVLNASFTDGYQQNFATSALISQGNFQLIYNGVTSSTLAWNASESAITAQLVAITGNSSVVCTNNLINGAQIMLCDFSGMKSVPHLLIFVNLALKTAGNVNVTVTPNYGFTNNTLTPSSPQYQYAFSSDSILITPIVLLPATSNALAAATVQFTSYGGYGTYTYSISVNNSGGSINSSTGLYTAGAVTNVSDTILVTDQLGNTQTASVTVI